MGPRCDTPAPGSDGLGPARPLAKKAKRYNAAVKRASQLLDSQRVVYECFQVQRDLLAAREQVLVDSILQLEEHAVFRDAVEQHEQQALHQQQQQQGQVTGRCQQQAQQQHHGQGNDHNHAPQQQRQQQQQQQQQQPASGHPTAAKPRYTTRLLCSMQPEAAQDVLSWGVDEWHNYFTSAASEISIMLHVLGRDGDGSVQQSYGSPATGLASLVDTRVDQAVDRLAASGLVGAIFGDRVGQQLGVCTSTNHLSMQLETPPSEHWRRVLLQLQPTYAQLCQLAAGFQEFARVRKSHQAMQLALTAQVQCSISCNPQTLVAMGRDKDGESASADGIGASTTTMAEAAAAGGQEEGEEEEVRVPPCSSLLDQLLRSLNHAFVMVQALMLNTLTTRQIALLVVSSFPFVPRAAPLMEAAHELLMTQQGRLPPGSQDAAAAAPAAADSDSAAAAAATAALAAGADPAAAPVATAAPVMHEAARAQVDVHMQQRVQYLQQQVQRWWRFELY